MKKETIRIGYLTIVEVWQPSVQLRFVNRLVNDFNSQLVGGRSLQKNINVLQQLHTSNLGNREWKDVPIETQS
ncbi:hypothetical protein [Flavobacterium muglaense]|uniref:Uncharacterized protein n=1 Tax=Flavobacterium muglaense TaxID=2764716 RepID=A0A923N0W2_9FLAO|nr:hypothetical protein [Flavobacterium muglaense]MBC5838782.1 hypothetical protein [Flavobacterium muglaense]MBC5845259.1 hypothetical protein [Flavobacterium muglaense]